MFENVAAAAAACGSHDCMFRNRRSVRCWTSVIWRAVAAARRRSATAISSFSNLMAAKIAKTTTATGTTASRLLHPVTDADRDERAGDERAGKAPQDRAAKAG